MIVAKIIDSQAAWQAVWSSVVSGVGVTLIFALAVLGATRSSDMRRNERAAPAAAFALLAVAAGLATVGAIVYAITLITTK